MSQTTGNTRITTVGRVMVPVSDQDRAIEFYTTKVHEGQITRQPRC